MEVEDGELGELCAQILENWNSPVYPYKPHQNPFSCSEQTSIHVNQQSTKPLSNAITKGSEKKNENIMKTNHSEHEHEQTSLNQPIIPVLVADTFFDKLLQHGADGIDIAALNAATETEKCDKAGENNMNVISDEISHTAPNNKVSTNVVKSFKDKDLNSGYIASGIKHNSPRGAHMQTRTCSKTWFHAKLRFALPLNKTIFDINIDDLEEKLWRNSAMDISDFFNYGLDEKQWKNYCRAIYSQIQAWNSRQSMIIAHESRLFDKERATGEGKLGMRIYECIPFPYLKNSSFYDSDVIIEVVQHESLNQPRRKQTRYEDEPVYPQAAKPFPETGKAKHTKCRMINGDTILPYPMDSYPSCPTQHREIELKRQQMWMHDDDAHIKGPSGEEIDFSQNNHYVTNYIPKGTWEMSKTIGQNSFPYKKIKQSAHSITTKE